MLMLSMPSTAATQVHSSLLSISVGAVLLPAAYHFSISGGSDAASLEQRDDILQMSHGVCSFFSIISCPPRLIMFEQVAIILLVIYVAYLFFQLYTHRKYFQDKEEKSSRHALPGPDLKPLKTLYMASRSTLNIAAYAGKDKEKSPAQRSPTSPGSSSSRESSPEGHKSRMRNKSEPNSPYAFGHSRSYLNSPNASASDISLPMTGSTSRFLGDHGREDSQSPTSSGSETIRYVYSKGRATPAPEHGTTVKLVPQHAQMLSSSSAGTAAELPTHAIFDGDPSMGHGIRFDEDMAYEEKERRAMEEARERERDVGPDGVVPKQPKLAWPLTLGLLVVVTVVRAVFFCADMNDGPC